METVRDIVKDAYLFAGITLEPDERHTRVGLSGINSQLNLLNSDSFFNWLIESKYVTVTGDSFTIGIGGDIDESRPMSIESIYVGSQSAYDKIEQISPIDMLQYKTSGSGTPCVFCYSGYPLAKVEFDVAPSQQVVVFLKPAFNLTTLDDTIDLPPEYRSFLRWALAVYVGTVFGVEDLSNQTRIMDKEMQKLRAGSARRQPITTKPFQRVQTIYDLS